MYAKIVAFIKFFWKKNVKYCKTKEYEGNGWATI